MIPGVDVHAGYGRISWPLVAASGVRFAYMKCSQGNERPGIDATYRRNVEQASANGIHVGAYHYAYCLPPHPDHPWRSPREEAQFAFESCKGLGGQRGELSPVVDAEHPSPEDWPKWGCSADQISEWLHEYCETATILWGRLPVIYTYPWWWRSLSAADVSWAAPYHLWMATYSHKGDGLPPKGTSPTVPAPWRNWSVWQFSADGSSVRVPGIPACPVDRDCIRDEETLAALTDMTVPDPAADTVPDLDVIVHPSVPLGRPALDGEND